MLNKITFVIKLKKFSLYLSLLKYSITNPSKGILMIQVNREVKKDGKEKVKKFNIESQTLNDGLKQLFPNSNLKIEQIKKEIQHVEFHHEEFFDELENKIYPSKEKPYPIDYSLDSDSGILLYVLTKIIKPETIVETGVAYGRSTTFILQSLNDNQKGKLYSVDSTFRPWETKKMIGSAIPEDIKKRWKLIFGTSKNELKNICKSLDVIDIFIHDSLHTYENMMYEFELIWPFIKKNGYLLSDDILGNNAFYDFCKLKKIKPMIFKQKSNNLFGLIKKIDN